MSAKRKNKRQTETAAPEFMAVPLAAKQAVAQAIFSMLEAATNDGIRCENLLPDKDGLDTLTNIHWACAFVVELVNDRIVIANSPRTARTPATER